MKQWKELAISTRILIYTWLNCACLAIAPVATIAQSNDPYDAIQEVAGRSSALQHFGTIYRLSEELSFLQSVALMREFDWDFSSNTAGTEILCWTIRLQNARDDAELEAKCAAIAKTGIKYMTDDQIQQVKELYVLYTSMSAIAGEMYAHLINGRIVEAAALFESQSLDLRRKIAIRA